LWATRTGEDDDRLVLVLVPLLLLLLVLLLVVLLLLLQAARTDVGYPHSTALSVRCVACDKRGLAQVHIYIY